MCEQWAVKMCVRSILHFAAYEMFAVRTVIAQDLLSKIQ